MKDVVVVLPNIRSLYNVGSFFRTGDAVCITKIICCGTTGTPKNKRLWKVSLGAEQTVPWEYQVDPVATLSQLRATGYQIVVVELTDHSILYTTAKYTDKIVLVFGAETSGVEDSLLEQADVVVHLPMLGQKNSLNVSVTGGVVLYYLLSATPPV